MSEQNKEIIPMELANKINRWDFDKSVAKVKEIGKEWQKMTGQIVRELFLAKAFLTRPKKSRNDSDENLYTWEAYCGAIDIDRQFADYWIKKFIPREISDNNKDVLLIKAPQKIEKSATARARMEARIDEAMRTGIFPTNWTDEENIEMKRRLKNAHLMEITEKYNAPTHFKANDYFADALKHEKDITNFKLEDSMQIQAQYKVFKYIEEYLNAFENPETQARAAFNIALKTRNLSNEYAEKNFQIMNALAEESGNDS